MFQILIAFYFFLIPFQWALAPSAGIDLAIIRLLSLFLVLIWFGNSLLRKKIILPATAPSFFLSSFLFLSTLSLLWADNREFSLRKILFLWSFLPLFFVFSSFFQEAPGKVKKIFSFFLAGGFLVALLSVLQFFSQFVFGVEKIFLLWTEQVLPFFLGSAFGQAVANYPSLLVNISGKTLIRASGFFPDPHMFSLYIGMLVPFCLGNLVSNEHGLQKRYGFIFFVLVLADLLSFSRGGYLGLSAGMIFFFIAFFSHRTFSVKNLFFGAVFILVLAGSFSFSPVGARFFSTFSLSDGSNSERLRLWGEAIEHIAERPLLGVGLGNYPLIVKPSAGYREPIYAHNLYLDIALETGMLGLFFFLGLILVSALALWKKWKREENIFALSLLSSLVVFAAHSFFESPLFSVHILPALLLVLAGGVL